LIVLIYPQGNLSVNEHAKNAHLMTTYILPCSGCVVHAPWVQNWQKHLNRSGQDPCQSSSQVLTFTSMCNAKHWLTLQATTHRELHFVKLTVAKCRGKTQTALFNPRTSVLIQSCIGEMFQDSQAQVALVGRETSRAHRAWWQPVSLSWQVITSTVVAGIVVTVRYLMHA